MKKRMILLGAAVLAASFFVGIKAIDWMAPREAIRPPPLAELPPLPPAPRNSIVMTPVVIPLPVVRDAAERGTPRNFAGKAEIGRAHV